MGSGRWVQGDFVSVSREKAEDLSPNTARPGDLIFTQRGTLGQVAIVPSHRYDRYIVSQSQMKLTVNSDIADVLFVYYYFKAPQQQDYIKRSTIQTGVPHTNLELLRTTPVILPPLLEQRAIAGVLGALDDKIELNRRMNETLEAMAQAVFKSWFVDFDPVRAKAQGRQPLSMGAVTSALFPGSLMDSELGKIPWGWRIASIGEVVTAVGGATPSTGEPTFWDGDFNFATPRDLAPLTSPVLLGTERRITESGLKRISSGLLPKGTVLLSSRAPIGYIAVTEVPVAVNQGIIAMVCDQDLPNQYVLHWAQVNMGTIIGNANGTTFLEISKRNFRPIKVLVPPKSVLARFTDLVDPLHRRVVSSLLESRTLAALRDTLLPKLLSGEIRVKAAQKMVAGAL